MKQYITSLPNDDHNIDEDNGSISSSKAGQIKQINDDDALKSINDDSNDSTPEMVIDENEEQTSINEEKESKSIPTITSLVEKEISTRLNQTEKRFNNNNNNNNNNNTIQPSPLITLTKSHSLPTSYQYISHLQQQYVNKGSVMHRTPIESSTLTNKPIPIDISSTHSHCHH